MEPYKIYDFEDEKAWLKGRLNGIGGSDASAVVGKNPYKTNIELFEEKTGRRIVPDISEKPYVIYGKEAEQYMPDRTHRLLPMMQSRNAGQSEWQRIPRKSAEVQVMASMRMKE